MEECLDAGFSQRPDQSVARGSIVEQQVVDVAVVLAVGRNQRPTESSLRLERAEGGVVPVPKLEAPLGDSVRMLELCPEEGGGNLAQEIGRARIDPGVPVDLA